MRILYNGLAVLSVIFIFNNCQATYDCIKPNIEIIVAPNSKKLQVNWQIEEKSHHKGDWIGLYYGETSTNDPNKNLKYRFEINQPKGWASSNIKFKENIDKNFNEPTILKWRAIYWRKLHRRNDEAMVTTKLSTFPNWMKHFWNVIKNKRIIDIFIPGTHDSVCNEKINIQINAAASKPKTVKQFFSSIPSLAVQAVGAVGPGKELTMTQDTSITEQLLLGIRYLDIRVIFNKDNNEYWGGHGGVRIIKMEEVIKQVMEFAAKTENEIIIFDVHQTIDFKNENDHKQFINLLRKHFSDNGKNKWIPPTSKSWISTMEQLLNNENRAKVIISYNDHAIVKKQGNGILWLPVKQLWANKEKINDLIEYFKNLFLNNKQPNHVSHSAMAQLTPNLNSPQKIIKNIKTPLNEQAEGNANDIYDLFMLKDVALKTNILATDYFMGMGTVRQAFIWNHRKFQSDSSRRHCDPMDAYNDWYYQHNIIE